MMIPLAVPNLSGNERKYLNNCIDTTFVSSVGEYVNEFESMVAEATGSVAAVATSSGTTGIHAALTAVGVKYGEIVIVPSFTFIASANAISHCGAIPWLMDIDSQTWCLDYDLVEKEIEENCSIENGKLYHKKTGKRIAAIMPVYTLGNIPNMKRFRSLADKYNIPLVVDAACAIGAKYEGNDFGNLADLSVLSFNGNKTITCGGGGAVIGCNKDLLDHVRHITTTARVWPDYDFDEVGFNYRMTNVQAAIGVAQMEQVDTFIEIKRKIHDYYCSSLKSLSGKGITFFARTDGASCWFSGIVLPEKFSLEDSKSICSSLKQEGVEAKTFWKPIHLQIPYSNAPKSCVSVSEELWQRIICLPCSTNISDLDLEKVSKSVTTTILSL